MHCAACSSSLKKFMSRQEGVQSVSVNLTTEKMDVVYDDRLDADKICELVSRLSFGTQEYISADALAAQRRKREDAQQLAELNGVKKRVILCVIFALPILYVSMGHMAGLPLPSFMCRITRRSPLHSCSWP